MSSGKHGEESSSYPADRKVVSRLLRGELFYQLIFQTAPLGILHFDHQGVVTTCNDHVLETLGGVRQRLVGMRLLNLPERSEKIKACVRRALAGRACYFEGDYLTVSGNKQTYMKIHFAPCLDGGVAIVEDFTEQKRNEREHQRSDALLDLLFRAMPVGFAFLDRTLRFVRVNDQLTELIQCPPTDLLGKRPSELLPSPSGEVLEEALRQVLHTQKPLLHLEAARLSIADRALQASVYPVRSSAGDWEGLGILLVDITERVHADQEKERLYQEAKEALRVRNDFLAVASHELKTPLTPLSLRLAALEHSVAQDKPLDVRMISQARVSLFRLSALINDLLDVSRIESGKLALRLAPVRLEALVERLAKGYEQRADHAVQVELPASPLWVGADLHRFEQVVVNLLENALKYSPPGSPVTLKLERRNGLAVLSVRDEGIGIPYEDQSRLFERYFRASNASQQSFGGLGLGLYICRDIVERHGGRIWVESNVGRGSTFYVALQALDAAEEGTPISPPEFGSQAPPG